MGTTHDPAWIVRESETLGSPSSHAWLRAFVQGWTRLAGWPRIVRYDRGTHNRGVFHSTLDTNGVVIRPAGFEWQEQIGRVERRGAMLKKIMSSRRQRIDGQDSQRMRERRQRDCSRRRFCSSVEVYALSYGVEHGLRTRATIVDTFEVI